MVEEASKMTRGVPTLEELLLLNLTPPPPTTDCCPICLDSVSLRGGRPLYAPGCCGACMMHLQCAFALPAADVHGRGGKCPLCRATIDLPRRSRQDAAAPPIPPPLAGLAARQTVAFQLPPPVPYAASNEEDDDEDDNVVFREMNIRLVMDQAHCTREAAIAAIRNNNGDLVHAIMELTI